LKFAIMGTGGVGGYYGGLLAKHGHTVTFIARGLHLHALQQNGLQVFSPHGDFHLTKVQAVEHPAEIGEAAEVVLFTVKTYDTERASQAILPIVGPQTTVVSLQNGVDAAERLGAVIGAAHLLGGATWISSAIASPGVVRQVSQFRRVVLGEFDGLQTDRLQAIYDAFLPTGITIETTAQIQKVLWTKFVFISALSALGALTRLPMGDYRGVPQTQALILQLMGEVEALARAQDIQLDPDVVRKSLDFILNSSPQIKASMQVDLEAGRQFELESLVGVIGRKGHQLGVPTPTADMIYAALLPINLKAQH